MKHLMKQLIATSFVLAIMGTVITSCDKEEKRPDPIELEMQVQHASAYNAKDGSIDVNILSGDPPFIYHWSTGDSTSSVSGLFAGDYTVKIIYGPNGSSFFEQTTTVEQPEPAPLNLTFSVQDSPVYGRPLGMAEVSVEGGEPPYTYLWSNGATTALAEDLMAGTYTVTVTDSGDPFYITTTGSVTIGQPEFVCGQDSVPDIDGNYYSTVLIGDQCWLGENLRTTHVPDPYDGELIPIDGRFCRGLFCQNAEGAHYTWTAMMNGAEPAAEPDEKIQGICPTGWHLPTRAMFEELEDWLSVDGNGGTGFFAGAKMKGENSSSGFDALFTGSWGFTIYNQAPYAGFWSATQAPQNPANARIIYLTQDTPFINGSNEPKGYGFNVRCIKDEDLP